MISPQKEQAQGFILSFLSLAAWVKPTTWSGCYSLTQQIRAEIMDVILLYGYGSIPIDTFLVGWTSIYQLFWGSLGTRVLTHPHIYIYYYHLDVIICCYLSVVFSRFQKPSSEKYGFTGENVKNHHPPLHWNPTSGNGDWCWHPYGCIMLYKH